MKAKCPKAVLQSKKEAPRCSITSTTGNKKMSTILKYINRKLTEDQFSNNASKQLLRDSSYKSFASRSTCRLSNPSSSKTPTQVRNNSLSHTHNKLNITHEYPHSHIHAVTSFKEYDKIDIRLLKEENALLKEDLKKCQMELAFLERTTKMLMDEDTPIDQCQCPKPMQKAPTYTMNSTHKDDSNVPLKYTDSLYLLSINELTSNDDT